MENKIFTRSMATSLEPRLNEWGKPVPDEYEIPDGYTEIEEEAFADDAIPGMTSIQIPESVKVIGKAAFKNCTTLKRITLPESCEIVKEQAFSGCKAARYMDIFDAVHTIGDGAFENCGLVSAVIPKSLKKLGRKIFAGCDELKHVFFSESWLSSFMAKYGSGGNDATAVEEMFGFPTSIDIQTY